MGRLIKKFAKLLLFVLFFNFFTIFPFADFINIYEESTSQNLSRGVIHEKILRFTDKGWLNINVLKIDLEDRYTSLNILTNGTGVSGKDTLTGLISSSEEVNKVIGAINGDFFDTKEIASMGPVVRDGELITTSIGDPLFATFYLDNRDNPFLEYWTESKITLENRNNDFILNIDYKNKPYLHRFKDRIVLLDGNWGELSFGKEKHPDIVEMVIERNRVKEIRENLEAVEIPEDGFVISAAATAKEYILNNFSKGDRISLKVETDPDFEKLELAMGGGSIILKDGKVVDDFTLKIPGRHPRTALGISKDREELILITVDGRTSSYVGASQTELAEILLELGAYEGINLDGGGSTEMVIKPPGEENITVANNLSSGYERRIVNGLAVLNTAGKSSLKDIIIDCEDTNIFVNTSREFNIKAWDRNYNPVSVRESRVKWSVSGIEGKFRDNRFFPESTGHGTITAYYNGKTASIDIKVIDNPVKLEISPSKIFIDTDSEVNLTAKAINDDGYSAKVDLRDLIWSIPEGLGEISNEGTFISSGKAGNDIITSSLMNLNAYIQVAVGYKEVILEGFENINGSFLSYPQEVKGSFELSNKEKSGKFSGKLEYDFTGTNATRAAYIVFNNGGLLMDKKPEKIGLWVYGSRGNNHWLRGKLTDSKGNSYNIDFSKDMDWNGWKFIEANIPSGAKAPLKLERLYIVEIDPMKKDTGYLYFDDITAFYKSGFSREIPQDKSIILDKRNIHAELENENSFRFIAHGQVKDIDTLLDNLVMIKLSEICNEADVSIFSNTIDQKLKDGISKPIVVGDSGYSIEKFKNSTFIKLDNSNGGIRATDYNQWIWLLDKIKTLDSDSVFVILPKPLTFTDRLEEKLFLDTFKNLKEEKGMDVWIFTGGSGTEFEVEARDGIRFVKLKSYPEHNKIDIFKELKYMVFTVNEGYVTYEIIDMYK